MKVTTTDFYLAAWLNANKDIILVDHTRENGRRSIFEFQGDNIESLVKKFNSNNATVNVNIFAESIRQLKSIMYINNNIQPNYNLCQKKESISNFN